MGNQSSQLEKPDSLDQSEHAAQANYIRGASDNDDANASQKSHDTNIQPYLNPSGSAEGFAFSSQAPQSTNPLAHFSHRHNLDPGPDPDANTDANTSPDNTSSAAHLKSPIYNFQGVTSSIDTGDRGDSPEQFHPRQSRTSKKQRRTRKHSSPTSETHPPESKMTSFISQTHEVGSPSLGAYSQEEPGSQVDQPDALYHLPVPSSEKSAKRGRKGKKKQHRTQMDTAQMFEADPTYSHYPPIGNPEYSLPEYDNIPQTSQADFEEPKSSKKRKRKSKHREAAQDQDHLGYSYGAENGQDLLSTQADELTAPTSPTNDFVKYIDPALTIGAPSQKRKLKDQGKKRRKKRKQDHGVRSDSQDPLDGINQESHDYDMDQAMGDIAESVEEPTLQLKEGVAANNSPSTENSFGNVAQSLYADHVRSQNPESSPLDSSGDASPEQRNDDEPSNVSSGIKADVGFGEDSDMDPAEDDGNMKIDDHSEGSDSEAHRIEDDDKSPEASASDDSGGGTTKYETKSDSSNAPDYGQHSEELGLDDTADLADTDGNDVLDDCGFGSEKAMSSVAPDDQIEVPSSVHVQSEELPIGDPAQHKKSSSGRNRASKPSLQDQPAEENVGSIAESPSPIAAAASRQAKGKGRARKQAETESPETVAGPSNAAPRDKPKQPKITSLLRGGPPASAKHTTPAPKSEHSEKNDKVTKGIFSQFELRNIDEAVDRWAKRHNMTDYARNELIHGNPRTVNSTEFWDSVHATCPNRLRQKVINQCRRKYHNFVARGTWTPEQNDELAQMYELHGNKYTVIGKLINRHPEDVRDRVRNYIICGNNMRRHAWSHEEESQLIDIVNEAIEHIKNLQRNGECAADSRPDDLVDWQLVSEKMNHTRSRLQCINKWKLIKSQMEGKSIDGGDILSVDELINKARTEAEAMTSRERYKLAKAVLECGASAESRIPWAKVRAQRIGFTSSGKRLSRPTLMIAWYRLKLTNPDCKTLTVPEIAKQLCAEYKSTGTLEYANLESTQLDAEHKDMEHKFNKLLKSPGTNKTSSAKTPFHAVNSDDEESGTGQSEDVASNSDRAASTDLGFDTDIAKHSLDEALEAEAEDSEPVVKPKNSRKGRSNMQVADASKSNGVTPSKKKSGKLEEGTPANSAKRILARRKASRGKRPQLPAADSDEQSSDTNASDVESIPARGPE